jgi:hypothetical protein
VLQTAGISIPGGLDGVSLVDEPAERPVRSESYLRSGPMTERLKARGDQHSLVSGKWKFVRSASGKIELYDIVADPQETNDLASNEKQVSEELARSLGSWLRKAATLSHSGARPDARTMEMLKSLGYVQ